MTKSKVVDSLIRERFECAIEGFNFYRVKIVMDALEWSWVTSGGRVPKIKEMEDNVWRLFEGALKDKKAGERVMHGSGGFEVEITENNIVNISFVAEESSYGYGD